jgi:NADH:ubiquinone oxidoreductase subunit 6 (subunit J)
MFSAPPPITADWLFYIIAGFTLVAAFTCVLTPNVIHSALALGTCFFGVAAVYVLLHAQFLAVAQVLIYVGDITVLILFALMLTRGVVQTNLSKWGAPPEISAIVTIILACGMAIWLRSGAVAGAFLCRAPVRPIHLRSTAEVVELLSQQMLINYLLPFEVASGILLMALVGAIVLAKEEHLHDAH